MPASYRDCTGMLAKDRLYWYAWLATETETGMPAGDRDCAGRVDRDKDCTGMPARDKDCTGMPTGDKDCTGMPAKD